MPDGFLRDWILGSNWRRGIWVTDDGEWIIDYEGSGGLAVGSGDFGVALENIIDSIKIVSVKMTLDSLDDFGGARTSLNNDNSKISIDLSYLVVDKAENALKSQGMKGSDGGDLKFTLSVALAHELGHAWGMVKDNLGERADKLSWYESNAKLRDGNNDRAVRLENAERSRLGLSLRPKH